MQCASAKTALERRLRHRLSSLAFSVSLLGGAILSVPGLARAQQTEPWQLSMNLNSTVDSNVRFRSADVGTDLVNQAGLSLSRTWTGPAGALTLSGSGNAQLFVKRKDLNRLSWGGTIAFNRQLSRDGQLSLNNRYDNTYTTAVPLDDLNDVPLPLSGFQRNRASARYSKRLGNNWGLATEIQHAIRIFEDPELIDNKELGASLEVNRQIGGSNSLGLNYAFRRNDRGNAIVTGHSAALAWNNSGRHWSWNASFGVAATTQLSQTSTNPVGAVSITRLFRDGSASVAYSRRVRSTPGVARERVQDLISGVLSRRISGRVGLAVNANYSRNRDPFNPIFVFDAHSYGANLTMNVSRSFVLVGSYNFAKRSGANAASAHRAGVSVAYGTGW